VKRIIWGLHGGNGKKGFAWRRWAQLPRRGGFLPSSFPLTLRFEEGHGELATTPQPPLTRLQKHRAAVRRADDELAAAQADLQTRVEAFGQDVLKAGPNAPSLETAGINCRFLG